MTNDPFKAKGNPAIKLYVLRISWRDGENIYVITPWKVRMTSFILNVCDNWDEGLKEQYGDIDEISQDKAIADYCDCLAEGLDPEFYELDQIQVGR